MNIRKIIEQHASICNLIAGKRVKQSLDILGNMIQNASSGYLRDEYDNAVLTYRNMVTYTIEGIKDPEREKVYLRLMQSILTISDKVEQDILSHYSGWNTYWVKQQSEKEQKLSGKSIIETIDDLIFKTELDEWLVSGSEALVDPNSEMSVKHRLIIDKVFNHLWLTDYYGDAEKSLLDIITNSEKFKWYESSIFTTAVTLSNLRVWQPEKIMWLISIYEMGREQVMERALSGLILNLHYYDNRLSLYPEIVLKIEEMAQSHRFREHVKIIVLQAIKSRETEKITRKLQNEILPQVAKLRPRIEERLDLDNMLPDDKNEGKNPDWSDMFRDSEEIFKTMEELARLQMEGSDVYMSTFANLKHFDFFKDFKNWFLPFHPDHEVLNEVFRDEILGPGTDELAEAMHKTPFICNSDKYSLVLNLKYLPQNQKSMMLKVFKMEMEGLLQMSDEDFSTDPEKKFRTSVTQYLQDFYRFYKLSPYRKEFEDIFSGRLDLYNSGFFRLMSDKDETEAALADYFFNKDFYVDALDLYLRQIILKPGEASLYEKAGYCYQQESDYSKALEYYRKAELIDRKPWTLKKIGLCLRRLKKFDQALEYYLLAGEMDPENTHTTMMAANCYLDLGEYENALQKYFRIEYSDPDNMKILRPIAFCYFCMGRFSDSEKYYDRISEGQLNPNDLMNLGHLYLCMGRQKEAIDMYHRTITAGGMTREQFMAEFLDDQELLVKLGVNRNDLPIILDYLLFIIG